MKRLFGILAMVVLGATMFAPMPTDAITVPSGTISQTYSGIKANDFRPLDDSTGGTAADTIVYINSTADFDTSVVWGTTQGAHLWTKISAFFHAIGNDTSTVAATRDSNNVTIYAAGSNDGLYWAFDDSLNIVSDTTKQSKVFTLRPWKYRAFIVRATAAIATNGKTAVYFHEALYYGIK
jgi:hypothetical protein